MLDLAMAALRGNALRLRGRIHSPGGETRMAGLGDRPWCRRHMAKHMEMLVGTVSHGDPALNASRIWKQ